jgi:sugar phosphate isomerase/epimerase
VPEVLVFVDRTASVGQRPVVEPAQPPDPRAADDPEDREDPETSEALDEADERGLGPWLWYLLGALAVMLAAGVVPALKRWRRWRRTTSPRVADRYAGAWDELLDHARDLGRGVPLGLTRPVEASHLDAKRLLPLAEEVDITVFGPTDPEPAAAEEFWRSVDREVAELRGQASGLRRLWSRFNPRSLF